MFESKNGAMAPQLRGTAHGKKLTCQYQTEGDDEWHFITVETVSVNPQLDDSRFAMPAVVGARQET